MERDEILRKPRPLISDRIDLRHRIMDALIDSGMKLNHNHLPKSIDKIDEIVWVDGDMRTTRLRYDLFSTFRRKGIDFDEEGAAELFEATADTLLARGTGLDYDGLGPADIELVGHQTLVKALELQAGVNERLIILLENLAAAIALRDTMPTGVPIGPLTHPAGDANQKPEKPSKPGTPGGKVKAKTESGSG